MTLDPYATLGIDKSASAAVIKAAYRRRARDTHPDRAGTADAGEFQEVVRAYGILSNPEAKKLFDESGVVDEANPQADRKAAMDVLVGVFNEIMEEAGRAGMPLDRFDIVGGLKRVLDMKRAELQRKSGALQRQVDERLKLRKRIQRVRSGENLFASVLTKQIEAMQKELLDVREALRIIEIALTETGNYESEVEVFSAFDFAAHGWSPMQDSAAGGVARMWPT